MKFQQMNTKIPVYFMPGLAASPEIFERINLSEVDFEMFFLEWILPLNQESIENYAMRLSKQVTHNHPVLIGVSFGGIMVQEMAKHIKVKKLIIISSVKTAAELPLKLKFAKATKAYKMVPTGWIHFLENLTKLSLGPTINQRLKLYEKYLSVRDKNYLDWSIENVIMWKQTVSDPMLIHIHGDVDEVFPIQYIQGCIVIKGGSHIMILNKFKWFNENLPKLILSTDNSVNLNTKA
jgi:pimeloyl-ACP methyl ester carboxylesterase